ncbi:MAG: hypothetical protein ACJAYG_002555 [Oceanicoccus sp.]|jgi:hypothetical protein
MNRYLLICLMLANALLISACSQTAVIQSGADAEVIEGNLYKVDHTIADTVHMDPAVKAGDYTAIMVAPLDMANVEIDFDKSMTVRNRDWVLTEKDKVYLQQLFAKALASKDDVKVVTEAGPGVLSVNIALTKIEPNAPKDDFESRPSARSAYFTEGFGAISIRATLADSQSGKTVAIVEDRKDTHGPFDRNDRITNRQDINQMFSSWVGRLARIFEKPE